MPCITDLTTEQLEKHLTTFGFTFNEKTPEGDHNQDLYWTPNIPGYDHPHIPPIRFPRIIPTEFGITFRQQEKPGTLSVTCETCLHNTELEMNGVLRPPTTAPDHKVPAVRFNLRDEDLLTLLLRAKYQAVQGQVFNRTTGNWDFINITDCCYEGHTMTLTPTADGDREARCPDCPPAHPAKAFVNTFRIGFLMAKKAELTLIEPAKRQTRTHGPDQPPTPKHLKPHYTPAMSPTLTNLAAVLHHLGMTDDNQTSYQRADTQRAVYLTQAIGVKLHYYFQYTPQGPHCEDLSVHHADLNEQPHQKRHNIADYTVREPYASAIRNLRHLMENNPESLTQREWTTLLSMVHYLQQVEGLDQRATIDKLARDQPTLAQHTPAAATALAAHHML